MVWLHTMKLTRLKSTPLVFSLFTGFCSHHNIILEDFYTPQNNAEQLPHSSFLIPKESLIQFLYEFVCSRHFK